MADAPADHAAGDSSEEGGSDQNQQRAVQEGGLPAAPPSPGVGSYSYSSSLDGFFRRLGQANGSRIWSRSTGWLSSSYSIDGASSVDASAEGGGAPVAAEDPEPDPVEHTPAREASESMKLGYRDNKFNQILGLDTVNLPELRKLSWNGVPMEHRPMVWQLLVGYMPTNRDRREGALHRKRREYHDSMQQMYGVPSSTRTAQEQAILRQILVDVPRTSPSVPLFHADEIQRSMERVLYVWAIRHPASGYVQGINDLITPLYLVFLGEHMECASTLLKGKVADKETVSREMVNEEVLREVEADVYWCLTKLLDNIQDHYTAMQPGLQRMVLRLEDLVRRIDVDLHSHFEEQGLQFMQFAFRWMNCLLLRELPLRCIVRTWDTCLSEEKGFESFHIYICAALLCKFSPQLQQMDFQDLVMFLQDIPSADWSDQEIELLLSQAFILSTLFEHSSAHLQRPPPPSSGADSPLM
jgi:hypothetical protein